MYEIKKITNKDEWEDFVQSQKYTPMNQSWKYGEFYKSLGEDFSIFGIYEEKKIIAGTLVLTTHAKRGNFLYIPYGPIIVKNEERILKMFTKYLKNYAREKRYDFIRVSPFADNTEERKKLYSNTGFRKAPIHALAETTWLLDLGLSEKELLVNMNKNHRNLIKRCEREGVRIEKHINVKDLKEFHDLHEKTAKRHNFHRFSNEYVEKEFENFSGDKEVIVWKVYLPNGKLDSAAVVYYYGKMACYRHGASLMQNKKLPTSYLLQWESIKEAKNKKMRYYNFWGIAPENANKKHPFFGITHFKKGFGGFQKKLLHAQDLIVSNKYWVDWTVETLRRIKRGF